MRWIGLESKDSGSKEPHEDLDSAGLTVTELSEMEARVLCAREDIPGFWRRPSGDQRKG